MAPYSSTLAWKIPWMEEPGGLQSMGSPRVGHDWATSLSLLTFMHWRRKWQPTPVFLPGEFQGRGAWWAAVDGVAKSRTRLKRLSSSSSIYNGNIHIRNHGQGDKQQTNWGRNHKAGTPNWRCWYFTEAFLTWATLWNMLQVISSTDLLVII